MAIPPPKIDRRNYQDLVEQTKQLASSNTEWRSPPPGKVDAGLALIRIFSRMAILVSDRVNRVLDRNLLAYINLIGTQLLPPQPARVPLSFSLVTGSQVDVLVPAQTQVAAPPSEGEKDEIIFETEQELLVSGTQLQALFVMEDRDYYSDHSDRINATIATQSQAFLAFRGDRRVAHDLYLYCEEIFDLPELATVTITIDTDSTSSAIKLIELFDDWLYWNDEAWEAFVQIQIQQSNSQVIVTLVQLPKLLPVKINGIKAKWLRVTLKPHHRKNLPEITQIQASASINQVHSPKACLYNAIALDLSKDFYPFGLTGLHNDTFAIQLDPRLVKPGVVIEINAHLGKQSNYTNDLNLVWEIGDGQQWQPVEVTSAEDNIRWSQDSSLNFSQINTFATLQFPKSFSAAKFNWIRARITSGFYGTRGKERKFVISNDVTLVASKINSGQREIIVDSVDELEIDDIIRIQSSVGQQQEEAKILDKIVSEKKLIVDHATRNSYDAGARVLRKITVSEYTSDTFDPPLIKSLTLTYKLSITRLARYFAYNDFNYCEGSSLYVRLSQNAKPGDVVVYLNQVNQLSIGEFLRFDDNHPEKRQIELIDYERQLVIFTEPLEHEHLRSHRVVRSFHPLTPTINHDSALYLGFNKPFPNRPNTLFLQVDPPDPQDVAPGTHPNRKATNLSKVTWEYASPKGWQPLVVTDETQALEESGLLQFIGPTDFIPSSYFGQPLYWLRVRKEPSDWNNIPFALIYFFQWTLTFRRVNLYRLISYLLIKISRSAPVPQRVRSVRTNTIWASQAITLKNEVLGSSNSELNQIFYTNHTPILESQQLEVQEGRIPSEEEQRLIEQQIGTGAISPVMDETNRLEAVWVRWQEMPNFYSSAPNDRHYVVDRHTGTIRFGDGKAGMIPPRGRNNIRLVHYRTGGGSRGNCSDRTIAELKTTIPYIDSVINWEAARGGNEQESLDRLKERAPKQLRHRDRAVTDQDFEDLAYEASTEVARVKVITPEMMAPNFNPLLEELWLEPDGSKPAERKLLVGNEIKVFNHDIRAGQVQVIVVPHSLDRQPTPSLVLINRIETFLQARLVPTMKLRVTGPKWQEIRVITEIVPHSITNADAINLAVEQKIQSFLHPLTGGDQGQGWSFGRKPHKSDLYAILEAIPGVSYIRALDIQPANVAIDQQTLIYSGQHVVTFKLLGKTD